MAIFSVIRFDGLRNRDWVVYKYPSNKIVLGSQLIVQEGQNAIFVKSGVVCDTFYPGTYTLNTSNLPIIAGLVNLPFGGETPFSAEIYFVNITTKLDIYWGTTDPIQLVDPKYFVRLRIRAFGQMALKLFDSVSFFRELIGGMRQDDLVSFEKIQEFYRGLIVIKAKTIIADCIISNKISALEISTKLEELSEAVKGKITDVFQQYGLNVVNFYIQSINFPDEDFDKINKLLEDKAAFEIIGDSRYVTKRTFDVYEGAANNQNGVAGAFVAGGVGLGAGLNMGNNMNTAMSNPMGDSAAAAQKQCPACNSAVSAAAKFCPKCGFNFNSLVCTCGYKLSPNDMFCPQCGKKVN